MNSYILLRDNKETGPHSITDLQQIGLKPNDLIWVECQSVSWRNPGEIGELKKMMEGIPEPVVNIQPPVAVQEFQPVKEEPVHLEEVTKPASLVNTKSVFVALPVNKTSINKTEQKPAFVQGSQAGTDKYRPIPAGLSVDEKSEAGSHDKAIETKYTRSLDEIKEMYVKNIEQRKTKARILPIRLPRQVMRGAVYVGLILVGAVTVLLFKSSGNKVPSIAEQQSPLTAKIQTRPDTILAESAGNPIIPNPAEVQEYALSDESATNSSQSIQPPDKKNSARENNTRNVDQGNDREESTVNDDRISIPRNEVPEIKKIPVESIASQVSVKTNSYTIAALGGIRNLEMTIQNDSKYRLDKVTVELRYLNPTGIILKTEDIHFKSIDPNATQTIPVKKSNRGVKVSYKITQIESKEIGVSTAGL